MAHISFSELQNWVTCPMYHKITYIDKTFKFEGNLHTAFGHYQLTLYKHFFAKKHGLDPSNIETHFALLKRTAEKDQVEIFRVTSGPKKTKNALNLLHKALYNIEKKNFIKNRLSCKRCDLYKTEYCT